MKNSVAIHVRYRTLGRVSSRICKRSTERRMKEPERKQDRRAVRTRRLLHQALVGLLAERPYEAIAVREILERAEVGRSTFYMHFRDKDELLTSGVREMVSAAYPGAPSPGNRSKDILAFSLPLFEHILQHRRTAPIGVGTAGWAVVHEHLRRVIAEMISGNLKAAAHRGLKPHARMPADLLVQYVASTFILVLRWCLEQRVEMSAREVNNLFLALVSPGVGAER